MKTPSAGERPIACPQSQDECRVERVGVGGFPEVDALYNAVYPWKPVPPGFARWRYASKAIPGACLGMRHGRGGPLVAAYGLEFLPAVDQADSLLVGLVSDVVVLALAFCIASSRSLIRWD